MEKIEFEETFKKMFDRWVETDKDMKQLCNNGIFEAFAYLAFVKGIKVGEDLCKQ